MKNNWVVVAIVIAVLAVPFALALRDDSASPETRPTEAEQTPDVARVAAPQKPEEEAGWKLAPVPDRSFYEAVFLAGAGAEQPALVGTLGGLELGMTRDEAALAAPAASKWRTAGSHAEFPGATLWLEYKGPGNTLSSALVSFSDKSSALSILAGAWGEPSHSALLEDGPMALWLVEQTRTRAVVMHWSAIERSGVALARYTPIRELIAPKQPLFGFESKGLLGSEHTAVLRAYADRIIADSRTRFQLPLGVTEYASEPQQAVVHLENDRVVRIEFAVEYRLKPDAFGEIFELLSTKLGSPAEATPGGRTTVFERGSRRISVERRADATLLFVTIEPR